MLISIITSEAQVEHVLETAGKTLVILDFYVDWCCPCHIMDKYLKDISHYYRATVLKIDVDQFHGLANRYRVTSMPTFIFIKQGKMIDIANISRNSAANVELTAANVEPEAANVEW
uniref:Thioredoxin domain-containing protein n=1 Tax=Glossina austeni TaxID=7395 RepID=A0A1A9VRH0_GLOAU